MEPGVFGSLEPEPLEKKTGAGTAWDKNQEPEPLEKKVKSRSRSRKKICQLPSPAFYYPCWIGCQKYQKYIHLYEQLYRLNKTKISKDEPYLYTFHIHLYEHYTD